MSRPKIHVEPELLDKCFNIVSITALLALFALPAYFYGQLPEEIPRHFNAYGRPNAYGHKGLIWMLPLIGMLLFCLFNYLIKVPHKFNYPTKITEVNAPIQYKISIRMMRILNAVILLAFVYMTYMTIQTGLKTANGLGSSFTLIFIALIFVPIIYFAIRSSQSK